MYLYRSLTRTVRHAEAGRYISIAWKEQRGHVLVVRLPSPPSSVHSGERFCSSARPRSSVDHISRYKTSDCPSRTPPLLLVHHLSTMEHCRLPIEVCEAIIDALVNYNYGRRRGEREECATLRACALTCRAWLPRSLISLYHTIILNGDERTRNAVKCLRERGDSLAIDVRVIRITTLTPKEKEDGSPPPSSPCHLVPYLLSGLPRVIRSVETVVIYRLSNEPSLGRPTNGSDIFLRSCGYFQSVQTLRLSNLTVDTFSYFARFITCFRALRHLNLYRVKFTKVNDYSTGPAKLKQYKLHTLAIKGIFTLDFCHLARWLLKADALSLLESLSYLFFGQVTPDLPGCISDIMTAAGASLKHLTLNDFFGIDDVDLSSNTSLQTIHLEYLEANSAASILSAISSRDLSTIELKRFKADGIADVDALVAILGSNQFTVLPKLNRVYVNIRPTNKWREHLAGTGEERKQVVVTELDGPFSKLRGVFGERLETEIHWEFLSDYIDPK